MSGAARFGVEPRQFRIYGVPYCRFKPRGRKTGCEKWVQAIGEQTKAQPRVKEPCELEVEFLLPPEKYPKDFPYGPDLDNLLKLFMDGLQKHVLKNDSLVVRLIATKRQVETQDETGACVIIRPPSWAITDQINQSIEGETEALDSGLDAMQRLSLRREPW